MPTTTGVGRAPAPYKEPKIPPAISGIDNFFEKNHNTFVDEVCKDVVGQHPGQICMYAQKSDHFWKVSKVRCFWIFWTYTHYACVIYGKKKLQISCSTHTRRLAKQNPAKIPKIPEILVLERLYTPLKTWLYTPLYRPVICSKKFENFKNCKKTGNFTPKGRRA